MKVELVGFMSDPEDLMAEVAAVCHNSKPTIRLLKATQEMEHFSITEFTFFVFKVSEFSRIISQQLFRHRYPARMQRSQRFVEEDEAGFVIPPSVEALGKEAVAEWVKDNELEKGLYRKWAKRIPLDDARFLLQNGIHTTLYFGMNFRTLREFCEARLCTKAQWEIRELAQKMKDLVKPHVPNLWGQLQPKCIRLGYCTEGKESCGMMPLKEAVLNAYGVHSGTNSQGSTSGRSGIG